MRNAVLVNNTLRVKESNTDLIRNVLRNMNIATRAEIADKTGLSIATCGNILKELLKNGEVFEDEMDESRGGRPARKYLYNKNFSQTICMCIQANENIKTLQYVVTNLYGEFISNVVKNYDIIDLDVINDLIGNLIEKNPSIKALGIGIPGMSDKSGTVFINDIQELNGVHLAEEIRSRYNIKVSIASSPNLTAYGYYKDHSEYANKTVAALIAPKSYPVGAGIIINDRMFRGDFNMAGEVSYLYYGMPREKMLQMTSDADIESLTVTALTSLISSINPSVILLTGSSFKTEMFESIEAKCKELIPEEFMPKLEMKIDSSDEYLYGVISMTVDSLTNNLLLIEK